MRWLWLAAALVATELVGPPSAAAQADMALVLALDVSGSVNEARFKLQREGVASALDNEGFAAMVVGSTSKTIEITVLEWAEEQKVVVPWTVVRERADLTRLALRIRTAPRVWLHNRTDPGAGIAAADHLFDSAPLVPDRKVIDLSGDGPQNAGEVPTSGSRDTAVARNVTVNGLAITSGAEPRVDDWYRANVMGGVDAFVIVADGFDAFADAFQRKLMLEVAGRMPTTGLADAR
jgi:hypothetical protein